MLTSIYPSANATPPSHLDGDLCGTDPFNLMSFNHRVTRALMSLRKTGAPPTTQQEADCKKQVDTCLVVGYRLLPSLIVEIRVIRCLRQDAIGLHLRVAFCLRSDSRLRDCRRQLGTYVGEGLGPYLEGPFAQCPLVLVIGERRASFILQR